MTHQRRRRSVQLLIAGLASITGLTCGKAAQAQNASYFSPTYAASQGSPYSSVYAKTFGAGGPPPPATPEPAPRPAPQPLVTSAGPQTSGEDDVVYVIENGRLLTYRAEDYARGKGQAVAGTAVPPAPAGRVAAPAAELPSITGRLYGAAPLETAAPDAPIRLVPLRKPVRQKTD